MLQVDWGHVRALFTRLGISADTPATANTILSPTGSSIAAYWLADIAESVEMSSNGRLEVVVHAFIAV